MCGLVGIVGNRDVAAEIYDALTMLQHRGQDAAGIMTCQQGKFLRFRCKKQGFKIHFFL